MDVISPLIANLQPAIAIEPGQCSLHHPAVAPEALAGIDPASCNARGDASLTQGLPTARVVIPFVRVQLVRSLPRSPTWTFDGLNGIYRRLQHPRAMDIGRRMGYGERDPVSVDHNMALRARFAAICRIRSGFDAPPGAGTLAESSDARDQSIWSASPSRSSSTWCILRHTPASCQSRKRRQQVMPLPQPISCGSISQGMPLRSTNRIPVSAARFATRGRPPLGLGGSGGSNGSMIAHSSSGSNGFAMRPLYHKCGFC
jgi:hypothetical protein